DKGRGMADVSRSLSDGYSTGGTAGTGFGAVRRLASEFSVQSAPGSGTAVLAVIRKRRPDSSSAAPGNRARYGVVCLPKRGEEICGDSWTVRTAAGRTLLLVADGLGHGFHA